MNPITADSLRRKIKIFGDARSLREMRERGWPSVTFLADEDDCNKRMQWCEKNFGDNWIWACPPHSDYVTLYFVDSQAALLFKLTFISQKPLDVNN